jgi:transposase
MSIMDLDNLEIAEPVSGRRRRFTVAEKRRFLSEASRPGETVSSVGRRYGLSVSLLFRWRRQIEGANARRTANRQGTDSELSEVESLRAMVVSLQQKLAQSSQEMDLLRRRSGAPDAGVVSKVQRLGGSVSRDGEA